MSVRTVALLVLSQVSPAAAEVCDKVAGDGWARDQGPVGAPLWQTGIAMLAAVAVIAFLIVRLRSRVLAGIAALGSVGLALLTGSAFVFPDRDPIREAAIAEGCVGADSLPAMIVRVSFFLTAAAAFLWMARRRASIR